MSTFLVEGGATLSGTVPIPGSKNAALPILCATLLTAEPVTLSNVPRIGDIETTLEMLTLLGATVSVVDETTITINTSRVDAAELPEEKARKIRASLLFAGPLFARFGRCRFPFPGGCVIGKRPIDAHLAVLQAFGGQVTESDNGITIARDRSLRAATVRMVEFSVTATENAIMVAVLSEGISHITMAACEPHVVDLCHFLQTLGADIRGVGTPHLEIHGPAKLHGGEYRIGSDYIQAATFLIAGAATRGQVTVTDIVPSELDALWQKFDEMGIPYRLETDSATTLPTDQFRSPGKIVTRIHPGFATDMMAPFAVLFTQCSGVTKIFETIFEGRLNYLFELEKMGARIEILNPHQAIVLGATPLRGTTVSSLDLRAGAAMVLAGLIARGTTEVTNIVYIDRGYSAFEQHLMHLGARIKRVPTQ